MPSISFSHRGSFNKTEKFLRAMQRLKVSQLVKDQAQAGVDALRQATPKDSGLAASSWSYQIVQNGSGVTITWTNSDVENGFPVAIMLQHGYGTGTGGYVQGRDYINPAMQPVFDKISDRVWKAVTSA